MLAINKARRRTPPVTSSVKPGGRGTTSVPFLCLSIFRNFSSISCNLREARWGDVG